MQQVATFQLFQTPTLSFFPYHSSSVKVYLPTAPTSLRCYHIFQTMSIKKLIYAYNIDLPHWKFLGELEILHSNRIASRSKYTI